MPLGARTNVNTYAAVHGYVTHKAEHKKIVIVSLHHKSLASELLPPPACGVNVIPIAISAAVVDVTITPHIRHVAGQTNGIPTGKYIHFVLAAQNPRFSLLLRGWPRTRRSGGLLRSSIAPKTTNSSAPDTSRPMCASCASRHQPPPSIWPTSSR